MHNSEWSLIIFTLLGQFSAGLMTGLLILSITGPQNQNRNTSLILKRGVFIAAVCMVIAMLASFFHLSAPLSSVYALSNLKYSWLSREILMVSVFTGLLLITSVNLLYFDREGKRLNLLLILSSVAGLLMVFSMAKIYMLPTVPAWNTPQTLIRFFSAGFITGAGFLLLLSNLILKETAGKNSQNYLILVGIILAALLIGNAGAFIAGTPEAVENIAFQPHLSLTTILLPWFLWVAGCSILIWQFIKPAKLLSLSRNLQIMAFVIIIIAALIERYFFYESFYRTGI
jgi:anaerobic dimethyl sulfoxide reductase subunit C (anchor subunit)